MPATAYKNEIINPVSTNTTDGVTEYTAKIGMMYASDYGFAADPSTWTKVCLLTGKVIGCHIVIMNGQFLGVLITRIV